MTIPSDIERYCLEKSQDIAHIGNWVLDLVNGKLFWSSQTFRMFGIPEDTELTYEAFLALVHPDDRQHVDEQWLAALQGKTYDIEHRIFKDGETRWVRERAELELDSSGNVIRAVGFAQDITERKQAEIQLLKSEERRRLAVRSAGIALWDADLVNGTVWWDETYNRLFGSRSPETNNSWDWWKERIHPEDHERVRQSLDKAMAGEARHWMSGYRFRLADGSYGYIRDRATITRDQHGKAIRMLGAMLDVTNLVRARQTEVDTEKQHKAIINTAMDGFWIVDLNGRFLEVNKTYCELSGYTQKELLGMTINDIEDIETSADTAAHIRQVMQEGEDRFESRHRRKDGSIMEVEVCVQYRQADTPHIVVFIRDITERKLRQQQYQSLVENLEAGVVVHAADTSIILCNPSSCTLLGLTEDQMLGKTAMDPSWCFYDENIQPMPLESYPVNRVVTSGKSFKNQEVGIQRPDLDELVWLLCNAFPVYDEENKLMQVVVTFVDITDRKRAELALSKNEERHSALLSILTSAQWVTDTNGAFLEPQPMFEAFTGQPWEEHQGFGWAEMVHPEDRDAVLEIWKEALNSKSEYRSAGRMMRAHGEYGYFEAVATPLFNADREIEEWVGTLTDVTERRQLEIEREEALSRLSNLANTVPGALYQFRLCPDGSTCIPYASESFGEIYRLTPEEVKEDATKAFTCIHPNDLESVTTSIETSAREMKLWSQEYRVRHEDGETHWLHGKSMPELEEDGSILWHGFITDITDRKNIDKELEDYRGHLEEMVEERTRQLAEAQQQAETANIAKSTFLANMSHEIRTPMNAIVGLTHLLQATSTSPDQGEHLRKIKRSAKHLLMVISDILDLSKIEAGKLTLEKVDFNLRRLFDDTLSMFMDECESRGVSLNQETERLPDWLYGDATRLRQCLLNYLGNAVKFTREGSITLRATLLQQDDEGLLLRFEVQDTGIGIPGDKQATLFHAFEQADASTTRKYGGSGLGLHITQRFAELMGGDVGVKSDVGVGSIFWLTARLALGKDTEEQLSRFDHSQPGFDYSNVRVLLVEDNEINREVAMALLAKVGVSVDFAEDGRKAVEAVRQKYYDLILMDVQMPEMDGMEATRLIRSMKGSMEDSDIRFTDVPILAMTANVYEEDRQNCLAAGMNDFIPKPVQPESLYKQIQKWAPQQRGIENIQHPLL